MKRRFKVYAMILTSFVTEVELDTDEAPNNAQITNALRQQEPEPQIVLLPVTVVSPWNTHYPPELTSGDNVYRIVEEKEVKT